MQSKHIIRTDEKTYLGKRKADWISSLFKSLDKSELVILGLGKLEKKIKQLSKEKEKKLIIKL